MLKHRNSIKHAEKFLWDIGYPKASNDELHAALEHNDILACGIARLLLWTLPGKLPGPDEAEKGWQQYLAAWRPGKPHQATWAANFAEAVKAVQG